MCEKGSSILRVLACNYLDVGGIFRRLDVPAIGFSLDKNISDDFWKKGVISELPDIDKYHTQTVVYGVGKKSMLSNDKQDVIPVFRSSIATEGKSKFLLIFCELKAVLSNGQLPEDVIDMYRLQTQIIKKDKEIREKMHSVSAAIRKVTLYNTLLLLDNPVSETEEIEEGNFSEDDRSYYPTDTECITKIISGKDIIDVQEPNPKDKSIQCEKYIHMTNLIKTYNLLKSEANRTGIMCEMLVAFEFEFFGFLSKYTVSGTELFMERVFVSESGVITIPEKDMPMFQEYTDMIFKIKKMCEIIKQFLDASYLVFDETTLHLNTVSDAFAVPNKGDKMVMEEPKRGKK